MPEQEPTSTTTVEEPTTGSAGSDRPPGGSSQEPAPARQRRSPRLPGAGRTLGAVPRNRLAALAAATVLLLVLAVVLGALLLRQRSQDSSRQEALAAANRLGEGLFTISPASLDTDTTALLDGSTGAFRSQFQEGLGQLRQQVVEQQATSTGRVLRTGIVSASDTNAVALVVADADVRGTAGGQEQQQTKHYRMQVTMDRVDDRWLVSDLSFVDPF